MLLTGAIGLSKEQLSESEISQPKTKLVEFEKEVGMSVT